MVREAAYLISDTMTRVTDADGYIQAPDKFMDAWMEGLAAGRIWEEPCQ